MIGFACERATEPDEIARCLAIRRAVFIEEQGVDEALEVDGLDATARHYLGWLDGTPIATARVRRIADGFGPLAKVQRVAVLPDARGTGAGAAIMRYLMDDLARAEGIGRFTLGSQEAAVPFYERLGYRAVGEPFLDANIPHRTMVYP